MVVLTEAFVTGLESFRQLKAAGDIQERMRSVQVILRRDLAAAHFDGPDAPNMGETSGGPLLSQQDLTKPAPGAGGTVWRPPTKGFFRIWQGSPLPSGIGATAVATVAGGQVTTVTVTNAGGGYASPTLIGFYGGGGSGAAATVTVAGGKVTGVTVTSGGTGYTDAPIVVIGAGYVNEGTDPDGIPSARAVDHMLHFTVDLSQVLASRKPLVIDPNRRENFLVANVPTGTTPALDSLGPVPDFRAPGTYVGRWGEVAYYLRQAPGAPTANGTPLFALYRRQAVIPDTDVTTLNMPPRFPTTPPSNASATPEDGKLVEMSCKDDPAAAGSLFFNSATEITIPERRFGTNPTYGGGGVPIALTGVTPTSYPIYSDQVGSGSNQIGDDLLLTDVVSFEVRIAFLGATSTATDFVNLYDPSLPAVTNTNFNATTGPMVFDAWSRLATPASGPPFTYDYDGSVANSNPSVRLWDNNDPSNPTPGNTAFTVPLRIRVLALQIILRVWDARTQQTRQITIIQDM
jgi:hypothetical protein